MSLSFEQKLQNYADLAIQVGVGLQPGQRLMLNAPIEAAPFVRLLAKSAYQAGARYVEVFWSDDLLSLVRYEHAPRDSFEEFPVWRAEALENALVRQGDASLSVFATDPELLKDQDPELVAIARRTAQKHAAALRTELGKGTFNWSAVSVPIDSWARKVFPGETEASRLGKLWDAIFSAVRADQEHPIDAWKQHVAFLAARSESLTNKQYDALRFQGPGTDLTVGLPENHRWVGGRITTKQGIAHVPNMPTEEVFTLPHKDRVDGVVQSSKPLSYSGRLIDDFGFRFERGRITDIWAEQGEEALQQLVETDEGASRLGEVGLVPSSSPISKLGILFYNTLFDENAATHLAVGSAYAAVLQGGADMSQDEFAAGGGNHSQTHVDFMIGSPALHVDGITGDGRVEPIMQAGEWVTRDL